MITLPQDVRADAIAKRFTTYSVVTRAAEECVEAGDALLHYRRALEGEGDAKDCRAHVAEEIADVLLMFSQLRFWDPSLEFDVTAAVDRKARRTGRRYGITIPRLQEAGK